MSASKCKIVATANMKDGRKKSAKETKPKEEKKKEQREKKPDTLPSQNTEAINEERKEKGKGPDQQNSLHIPAAASPGLVEEKDATSLLEGEGKHYRHSRVRSFSEGDAIEQVRGEGDGLKVEGEEKQTHPIKEKENTHTGNQDVEERKGKSKAEGNLGLKSKKIMEVGAGEEASEDKAKSWRKLLEEDLLDILSDLEDSTSPLPRKSRRRRTKAKSLGRQDTVNAKANSLGRQDTVVRHMLVRGSKRPPVFIPSADAWPGRL